MIIALVAFITNAVKERRVCRDFSSPSKAQEAFNKNPHKYKALDRDHDGIVCEY